MRFFRLQSISLSLALALGPALGLVMITTPGVSYGQESTGGLQGTVKDPSGAVVSRARLLLTGTTMIGSKELVTDASGYYHFANLPPGTYSLTVSAQGFTSLKRGGLVIQAGHLPTLDVTLQVGAAATTVEVTESGPVIDTTTTQTQTNINSQILRNAPTGTTFQSVIQYAPMARNEPLSGMSVHGQATGGAGGSLPGSDGNGLGYGFSIGGAADSESSYLVEGQDTENISGGYSKANVPMDFIQEVQMTTSGVPAEYGGALGGVVNVILKKGGNDFHGEVFSTYESSGTDANPVNGYVRFDPSGAGNSTTTDPISQVYQARKDHFRYIQPGVVIGGPIVKDRLWFVTGFNPLYSSTGRSVNFSNPAYSSDPTLGMQYFTQDRQTYYGYGRVDAAVTDKIRLYASWLTQYGRETGQHLPIGDPIAQQNTYINTSIESPISAFSHGLGSSAPNLTFNAGADVTLTQKLVATTRYGYFFDNYHDFGWPTSTPDLEWSTAGTVDNTGAELPANLQKGEGTTTTPYNSSYTLFNADKHYQFNQDFAFYKGGWWGSHNFKFGYQLNHLVNMINQNGNVPFAYMDLTPGDGYSPLTQTGADNCDTLTGTWGACAGQYGYLTVQDFATILTAPASDWNHAFYVQDSWTVGKGVTLDVGLRIEKENLPAPAGVKVPAISFNWSDKIEPRLGAAWDPTGKGKMKIFGSYDVVNDVMKLLLAQTSWGAQAYQLCTYPLGPDKDGGFTTSDINLVFKGGRACPNGPATTQANFANGVPVSLTDSSTGVSLIENVNERPWEPVAPGVKPYRQHEYVVGWDYQISPRWSFEARYDRRRLDHAIEDAALSDVNWGEIYAVVNPGEGVDSTIDKFATYLGSLGESFGFPGMVFDTADFGTCPSCPANAKPIRNYDGMEMRLMMAPSRNWTGMFSYTYSSLWGNYPGLTTTDQTDGGTTGRNSPDTTRAFDEPFYYFGANGKSTSGPLPTDRPNVFKGLATYTLPWWRHHATTFGLFQYFYQGTPMSSYMDLLAALSSQPYEATYVFGRGQWVDMSGTTGNLTLGTPYSRRTPWYVQSDLNLKHEIKVGDHENIAFEATALNALNQHAVTAYWGGMNSLYHARSLHPGPENLYSGAPMYQEVESGYNVQQWINRGSKPVIPNGQYGKPYLFQNGRQFRLGLRYTF